MTSLTDRAEARVFARLARDLVTRTDLSSTCDGIVAIAKSLTGCDVATLWTVNRQGLPMTLASTDPALAEVYAEAIASVREGPEWDCLAELSTTEYADLAADGRWAGYRSLLLRLAEPPLSGIAFPIGVDGAVARALVLTSRTADFFDENTTDVAATLADHISIVLEAAVSRDKAENLELALQSNRRIGIAIGVIMATQRKTADQAFDVLRGSSQQTHLKLRDVAEEIIFTGTAPTAAPRRSAPSS